MHRYANQRMGLTGSCLLVTRTHVVRLGMVTDTSYIYFQLNFFWFGPTGGPPHAYDAPGAPNCSQSLRACQENNWRTNTNSGQYAKSLEYAAIHSSTNSSSRDTRTHTLTDARCQKLRRPAARQASDFPHPRVAPPSASCSCASARQSRRTSPGRQP